MVLGHDMQDIRLVFVGVNAFLKLDESISLMNEADIVSGSHIIGADGAGALKQKAPTDVAIAVDTVVGGQTLRVVIDEVSNNSVVKDLAGVNGIKWNSKLSCHAPGLGHCVGCATAVQVFHARF